MCVTPYPFSNNKNAVLIFVYLLEQFHLKCLLLQSLPTTQRYKKKLLNDFHVKTVESASPEMEKETASYLNRNTGDIRIIRSHRERFPQKQAGPFVLPRI